MKIKKRYWYAYWIILTIICLAGILNILGIYKTHKFFKNLDLSDGYTEVKKKFLTKQMTDIVDVLERRKNATTEEKEIWITFDDGKKTASIRNCEIEID